MPMIVVHPAMTAPMTPASPTDPVPKTAMLLPAGARSEFSTAPAPVWMPHPNGAATSKPISSGSLTTLRSPATAWVAKEDCPKKWPWIELAVPRERARAVAPGRREVVREEPVAVRRPAALAGRAGAARVEGHADAVARRDGADSRADALDGARALVAEDRRERHRDTTGRG